ncbi:hemerythrin domain-containing protein [Peristeroidobacter agariperforans]|uniref:hemerythrin domain-containing protein n=1 Tax=Peristeroidobacter agariperforans TaxID=268404 RepID=UPI0018E4FBB7|nr:hemerythrin domain-containing protein [Peristeroidobacter agariperforans]
MVKSKVTDESEMANAIELLKSEHQEVTLLFDEFAAAEPAEQEVLAREICQKLTVHAQIEEEILYPAAKGALEAEDVDLVNEAEVEHASAKDLIAKIEAMDVSDESYKATVKVLAEYVKHHVQEEEDELFPLLEGSDLDLDEMGTQLAERKAELLAESAVEAADDDSAMDSDDEGAAEAEAEELQSAVAQPVSRSKAARKRA